MAVDEDTGVDPVAKDGEPDELAAKRRNGSAAGGSAATRGEQAQIDGTEGVAGGQDDDGQLFAFEHGRKVTLGTLIGKKTPVEYEFKMQAKGIPGAAGMNLMAFDDPDRVLVVPGRAGKVEVDPTYDGEGNVKKVTVRANFKPSMAYDSRSEAAQVALAGEG